MKQLLKYSLLAIALLSTTHCIQAVKKSKKKQPNLILIQTDEHNFRTLGCYRQLLTKDQAELWGEGNVVETPHIDGLAKNGVTFDKFYAATPVCSPSRGSLISGMYPQNSGVTGNDMKPHPEIITYSQVLSNNGYKTGFFGKWHLNGHDKPGWAPEPSFGFDDNKYMFNRGHWKKLDENEEGPFVAKNDKGKNTYSMLDADEKTFTTDYLTDRSINFIQNNKDNPFAIYISYPDPHGPDKVRAPYDSMYKHMNFTAPVTFNKSDENVPSWAEKQKGKNVNQAQYFGMVKCIDDNVGRLIAMLEENDLLENTIIVFTSDHGDLRGEHHRQNKGVPLEASMKVPFIVQYPPQIPAGKVVKNAFGTADFGPTILSFMGYETPEMMEGHDFSELLSKPEKQAKWQDITFARSTSGKKEGKGWVAAITSRYKLVLSILDEPWLIDMEVDPDEVINQITDASKSEVIKELASQMDAYGKTHKDPFLMKGKMRNDLNTLLK